LERWWALRLKADLQTHEKSFGWTKINSSFEKDATSAHNILNNIAMHKYFRCTLAKI
jgi:hypothetical protein